MITQEISSTKCLNEWYFFIWYCLREEITCINKEKYRTSLSWRFIAVLKGISKGENLQPSYYNTTPENVSQALTHLSAIYDLRYLLPLNDSFRIENFNNFAIHCSLWSVLWTQWQTYSIRERYIFYILIVASSKDIGHVNTNVVLFAWLPGLQGHFKALAENDNT